MQTGQDFSADMYEPNFRNMSELESETLLILKKMACCDHTIAQRHGTECNIIKYKIYER